MQSKQKVLNRMSEAMSQQGPSAILEHNIPLSVLRNCNSTNRGDSVL